MRARLTGHEFDLLDLADFFPTGDPRVVKDGDTFYIESAALNPAPGGRPFYEAGPDLIRTLNGAARAMKVDFQLVEINGYVGDDGKATIYGVGGAISGVTRIRATGTVIGPDGKPVPPPPPPGPGYLARASTDPDAAEVFAYLSRPDWPTWYDLYKVYEVMRSSRKLTLARQAAGFSKDEMSRFTRTANHPGASGAAARHARDSSEPPENPMTLQEGDVFIRQVIRAWLDLP